MSSFSSRGRGHGGRVVTRDKTRLSSSTSEASITSKDAADLEDSVALEIKNGEEDLSNGSAGGKALKVPSDGVSADGEIDDDSDLDDRREEFGIAPIRLNRQNGAHDADAHSGFGDLNACELCGQKDHRTRNCHVFKRGAETAKQRRQLCYSCGTEGHIQRDCPKRSRNMPNHRAQNTGQDANKPGGSGGRKVTVPMPEHGSERQAVVQLRSQLMAQGKFIPPSGVRGLPNCQQITPFLASGQSATVYTEEQMLRDMSAEKKANEAKCGQKEVQKPPVSDLKDVFERPRKVTHPKAYEITRGVNREFTSSEGSSDDEEDSKEKTPAEDDVGKQTERVEKTKIDEKNAETAITDAVAMEKTEGPPTADEKNFVPGSATFSEIRSALDEKKDDTKQSEDNENMSEFSWESPFTSCDEDDALSLEDDEAAIVGFLIEAEEDEELVQEDDHPEDAGEEETTVVDDSTATDEQVKEELAPAKAKLVDEEQHKPSAPTGTESTDSDLQPPETASTNTASDGHKQEDDLIKPE